MRRSNEPRVQADDFSLWEATPKGNSGSLDGLASLFCVFMWRSTSRARSFMGKSGAREANKELGERVEFEIFVVRHSSVFSELLGFIFFLTGERLHGKIFRSRQPRGKINLITISREFSGCSPVELGDDWNALARGAQSPADVGHHRTLNWLDLLPMNPHARSS